MSLAVSLHTTGPVPDAEALERWLTEQGEPFTREGDRLALRALPVTLEPEGPEDLQALLSVSADTPLSRLVDLLFDLSVVAGADVMVTGETLTRAGLWVRLADAQDRLRIARALDHAEERGSRDEVLRRLWATLAALEPGRDVRWSAELRGVVELREVGAPGGLTIEDAAAHGDHELGDLVPVPVPGPLHLLVWRWLSEAYPSLSDR